MADGGIDLLLDSWQGPLAHLLEEARRRRVDLGRISMTALVDACLARLVEIPSTFEKADQLVIIAALVELKSGLLLPEAEQENEASNLLRARLLTLARIRNIAADLMARDQLGRDVFARGAPEIEQVKSLSTIANPPDLLDLVRAYARLRTTEDTKAPLEVRRTIAMTLREGLEALGVALPIDGAWVELFALVSGDRRGRAPTRRSAAAAGFAAALEMARRGDLELRQNEAFGALSVRRKERTIGSLSSNPRQSATRCKPDEVMNAKSAKSQDTPAMPADL